MTGKNDVVELIAVVAASLSVVVASLTVWKGVSSIFRRLAIIQNKLTSLKNLLAIEKGRTNDLENFLANSHGYVIREFPTTVSQAIDENYNSEDTGF